MSEEHARTEMDLAFGSTKPYGSSRSIIRRIATSLPIKPCPRVHFQLFPYREGTGVLIGTRKQRSFVASLADIAWIDEEEEEEDDEGCVGNPRSEIPAGLMFRVQRPQRKPLPRQRSLPSLHQGAPDPQGAATANDEAIQKIGVLETELAKLRAQIAQIVMAQEKTAQSAAATGVPPPPPSGALPPPPPPPPPPLPPPGLQRTFSAIELIKERRGKNTNSQTALDSKQAEIPNMLEVLKDISKVKLRSVKSRSVDEDTRAKPQEPADAAALIAEALKRKFAHRYRHGSDQDDKTDLPHPVPEVKVQTETPLFGQHMLKPTGKRKLV
uniref:Mitochondrial fission regulator n=2 Tax=Nothobranchius korthausae TaxID=1143690 RepID=A0A1A8EZN7_9TELE